MRFYRNTDFWLKLLICGFSLLMLKGCFGLFYLRMTHLSDEDLLWTKYKTVKSPASFSSDSGHISKLVITESHTYNSGNPFGCSSSMSKYYEANSWVYYEIMDSLRRIKGSFAITRVVDCDSLCYYSNLGAYQENDYMKPIKAKNINIRDHEFENCLFVSVDTMNYAKFWKDSTHLHLLEYIISRDYGLLYYKLRNGESFYRNF